MILNKEFIIGCDEVGTGALAGPLVVCGVRAPKNWLLAGLNDSKKLSEKKRIAMGPKLAEAISKNEISFCLAERTNVEIDLVGMAAALKSAYVEVFHKLHNNDSLIIVDGNLKFDGLGVDDYNVSSLVKADAKITAVMAASIIAKNYRDEKMKSIAHLYPQFDFESNVGYGSADHLKAIAENGPSRIHRMSYAPMKNMI